MSDRLPRPAEELERLARHYDDTDASDEIAAGEEVTPEPMLTTSLRLRGSTVEALRREASLRGMRYTALLREIAERHVALDRPSEASVEAEHLERLEAKVDRLAREIRASYRLITASPAEDEPDE